MKSRLHCLEHQSKLWQSGNQSGSLECRSLKGCIVCKGCSECQTVKSHKRGCEDTITGDVSFELKI